MEMVQSIKQVGVHTPCLVRPKPDGGYELLSGHRRKLASTIAGVDTLPLIVREMDDDTATILVVDGIEEKCSGNIPQDIFKQLMTEYSEERKLIETLRGHDKLL